MSVLYGSIDHLLSNISGWLQATKGLAAEYGPEGIRVNSVCPLLSGTGL